MMYDWIRLVPIMERTEAPLYDTYYDLRSAVSYDMADNMAAMWRASARPRAEQMDITDLLHSQLHADGGRI